MSHGGRNGGHRLARDGRVESFTITPETVDIIVDLIEVHHRGNKTFGLNALSVEEEFGLSSENLSVTVTVSQDRDFICTIITYKNYGYIYLL